MSFIKINYNRVRNLMLIAKMTWCTPLENNTENTLNHLVRPNDKENEDTTVCTCACIWRPFLSISGTFLSATQRKTFKKYMVDTISSCGGKPITKTFHQNSSGKLCPESRMCHSHEINKLYCIYTSICTRNQPKVVNNTTRSSNKQINMFVYNPIIS